MKSDFHRSLHFKIASGVIATILVLATADSIVEYFLYRNRVIEEVQASGQELGRITLQGLLEIAMLGEHPQLLQSAMQRLVSDQVSSSQPLEEVSLLNLQGEVRFSSNPSLVGRSFSEDDSGCAGCHRNGENDLPNSIFQRSRGLEVLRIAIPVPNKTQCRSCHDPRQNLNGVLLVDYSMDERWAEVSRSFQSILLKTTLTVLAILAVLGILMNRMVISPIKQVTAVTTKFGERPESSSPASEGGDEIGKLGSAFNRMASDLKASIEELKRQRSYLQDLMNSLDDGLMVVNPDMQIEMLNSAAFRHWGEKIRIGSSIDETVLSQVSSCVEETLVTGGAVSKEIELEGSEDRVFYDVSSSPVWDQGGDVARVIVLARNVSVRKALEKQVNRAERLASVGQLAAGVAHEINNPMAAITTCAEGLERYLRDREHLSLNDRIEITDYLGTIGEAASRCKDITQRLLSLTSEPEEAQFQAVDLGDVLTEVLTLLEHQAKRSGTEIERVFCTGGIVLGDPKRLYQLALNLLLNSLEAVGDSGRVRVVLDVSADFVQVDIADNGHGIPEEQLSRLFDPFFTTKSEGRGTGLGLAISESIVRQHQGRISIESSVGKGTRVAVVLPRLELG